MLTQKRLKEVLCYDKITGIFIWKVNSAYKSNSGDVAGRLHDGYVIISIDGNGYRAHRLAWLYTYGYLPESDIDHRNRVRHNNWIDNLREISQQCNARNAGKHKDNSSGVKGVSWNKHHDRWHAKIGINNKSIHLGAFIDFSEAVAIRLACEQCLSWSDCHNKTDAAIYMSRFSSI